MEPSPIDLPRRHRIWRGFCIVVTAILIGLRGFFFAFESPPADLESALRPWVTADLQLSFLLGTIGMGLVIVLTVVVAGYLVLRRRALVVRDGAVLATSFWLHSWLWALVLCETWVLDLNPELALMGAASFALAAVLWKLAPTRRTQVAVWIAFLVGAVVVASDRADAVGVVFWALFLLVLYSLAGRIAARDRLYLAVAGLAMLQAGVTVLPLFVPIHGGNLLAHGLAYSFCESPSRERLYAVVPECRADRVGDRLEQCRDGYIEEFDTRDLSTRRVHRIFDESFYGRLEQIVCFEDTIQVGMEHTVVNGAMKRENVIEFPMDDPAAVERDPLGPLAGSRIMHDRERGALFYVGAFADHVHRLDRATGEIERVLEGEIHAGGSPDAAIDSRRRRLFLSGGYAPVLEFDLDSLELVGRYPHTLALEIALDEELGRLFISGFWGLEVYDLASGKLLVRRRLGFVGRKALVDARNNLVYVPTFMEGKIRVLDRITLEPLGKIPIGLHVRYPYISVDGNRFFASSYTAQYYWPYDALAERFR